MSSEQSKSTAKTTRSSSTKKDLHSLHQEVTDQELNVDAVMHLEKRYFGQFKVPLTSILFNSKIEGFSYKFVQFSFFLNCFASF